MVASVMTSVAAVLALLASSVAAEQMDTVSADVLRTVADGVAAGGTDMQTRLQGMKRYTGVGNVDLPSVGVIYMDPFNPLAAGDTHPFDMRDSVSAYVCNVDDISVPTVFHIQQGNERGGFALISIANEMDHLNINVHGGWGVGWFLSAHDHYRSDTRFPGFVSVMLHNDENKAAVWDLEVIPGKDPNREDFAFRLKLVANRDASATYTEGWYLTVPPGSDRDGHSNYVALTDDASLATPVFVAYY